MRRQNPDLEKYWSPGNEKSFEEVSYSSSMKAEWVCNKGHKFKKFVFYVNKHSLVCPYCTGKFPIPGETDLLSTDPSIAEEWSDRNTRQPEEVSRNSSKTAWWSCRDHGHEWKERIDRRTIKNYGCPFCSGQRVHPGFNDLASRYPDIAEEWSPENEMTPEEVTYGSSKTSISWVCSKDSSHTWKASPNSRTNMGAGCPICNNKRVVSGVNDLMTTDPDVAKTWSPLNSRQPSSVTSGSDYKALWDCEICGGSWECRVYLRSSRSCPYCSGQDLLRGFNDLQTVHPDLAGEWGVDNNFNPSEIKANSSTVVQWVCSTNNDHMWSARVWDRASGSGCPKCSKSVSAGEVEVLDVIKKTVPDLEVIHGDREAIGKQLDIYIPSLRIAVEFNGLYWHRHGSPSIPVYEKMKMCTEAGIDMYVVWEHNWRDRREIVEKWLINLLGRREGGSVGARKCSVVQLSHTDASQFLDNNHVQGSSSGSLRIGLRYEDSIVAVAVFKRYGRTLTLERYATSVGVPGGFTKLISWVDANMDFDSMRTFADRCVSKGSMYESTGWTHVGDLPPDYSYLVSNTLRHKFNYRLDSFRKSGTLVYEDGKSERELAEMNGLFRVYDAGKMIYERTKSE